MVLSLTLPEPGKEKRIKDVILDILIFEWPLTLSQIYNRISKNYSVSVSCQAVYKAMTELVSEGVLIKQDKLYSIDIRWIDKIKEFANHVESNYKNDEKLPLIDGLLKTKTENNVTVLTFDSIIELDKAWVNIKKDYYKSLDKKNDITFWEGNHCWWLLVYPELEYGEMEILSQKKVRDFTIIHNDTPLDKIAQEFYEKAKTFFKISNTPFEGDMTVFGDTIMQVNLPRELKEKIDDVYKKCKTRSDVDIHCLLKDVLTKKTKINLVLTKNKEIADQLKQKVARDFNQKV